VILDRLQLTPAQLEAATGWSLKPEGLCKADRCVPLRDGRRADGQIDVAAVADLLGMPIVRDQRHNLTALGLESGGRMLESAELPHIVLPDVDGNLFDLTSLRGQKVLLAAWASW
jgi:hypothetical protein